MISAAESALVILAPEAEPLVKPFRERYDPSAAEGMPAHMTLLYPFKPPVEISPDVTASLRRLFSGFSPFHFSLAELQRFPEVLYLAPEPDAPFRALTRAIAERFPENPPYGGAFAEVIPHLTVAQLADRGRLDEIAADFLQLGGWRLPLHARAAEVALMDNTRGTWEVRTLFQLASITPE